MNEKEISELIDLLYPHFFKKLKSESIYKNCIKSTNATVNDLGAVGTGEVGTKVGVKFPYDPTVITVINKSATPVEIGDLVCLHYCIDLKNAYIAYKV